jgi:hypothetical protein
MGRRQWLRGGDAITVAIINFVGAPICLRYLGSRGSDDTAMSRQRLYTPEAAGPQLAKPPI